MISRISLTLCMLCGILIGCQNTNNNNDDQTTRQPVTLDLQNDCFLFSLTEECRFPFPNMNYLIEDPSTATHFQISYPDDLLPQNYFNMVDMERAQQADGFSPTTPILVHFGRPIHEKFLVSQFEIEKSMKTHAAFTVFDANTKERVPYIAELDINPAIIDPQRQALIIRPMYPLNPGHRYFVTIDRNIHDANTEYFDSPIAYNALRSGTVTTNSEIEELRPQYEKYFSILRENNIEPSNTLVMWDFVVASKEYLQAPILSMYQQALLKQSNDNFEITSVQIDPNEYLARIIKGNFSPPNFLNAQDLIEYDENFVPIMQENSKTQPFTLVIPRKAYDASSLHLVLGGHGIFQTGESIAVGWGAKYIHPLTDLVGGVFLATDWSGFSAADQEWMTQDLLRDPSQFPVIMDRMQQAILNNLYLIELTHNYIQYHPDVSISEKTLLDPDNNFYYGASLGGILGGPVVSISDRFTKVVLGLPGCAWNMFFQRSIIWEYVNLIYSEVIPDQLMQQLGIAILQARFDFIEPLTYTSDFFNPDLFPNADKRQILLQEAVGDVVIPNITTRVLARSLGVQQMNPSYDRIYDTELVSVTNTSAIAQYWHPYLDPPYNYSLPPEGNQTPTFDNEAHYRAIFLPEAIDQVEHFFLYGEIRDFISD